MPKALVLLPGSIKIATIILDGSMFQCGDTSVVVPGFYALHKHLKSSQRLLNIRFRDLLVIMMIVSLRKISSCK